MGATLDALHRLQVIEIQLRSVREQIESRKRTVATHERRVNTLQRRIADCHQSIRSAQAEADRHELDRCTHEERINKLRDALNRTKTNKEYAAVLTELNIDKANALKTEDTVLAALSRVDDLRRKEAELRASLEAEQARLGQLRAEATDLEGKLAGRLGGLEARRQAACDGIPPAALQLFERACEKHEGQAMALIEQAHPRRAEYTCSGCNMSITLETVNALQSRDAVLQCHTCSRILYLEAPADSPA